MIKIYSGWADDFTGLGMGVLDPSECKIEEEAGGLYELEMKQPMDEEHRDWLIEKHRIIKASAPVRESPKYELAVTKARSTEINREIWVVTGTSVGVRLRTGPGTGYKRLSTHKNGTEVIVLEKTNDSWYNVCLVNGGEAGYMSTKYLTFSRNETENIAGDTPGKALIPKLSRSQLFRIYDIKRKSKDRTTEVLAQHITYDLKGVTIKEACKLENVPANEAISQMVAKQDRGHDFEIICECTNPITADYTGRNWIDCLLNAEDGIVAQCKARLIRDNYTIHILPGDELRDLGAEIRYGKNMLDAELHEDCADIITRIRPVGKTKDGEPLYGDYVDSSNIEKYPVIYTKDVEYDVQVGKDDIKDETQAKEKLKELANADFEAGVDLPTTDVDAGFVRGELTEGYTNIANEQALHMYDIVRVRDSDAGIKAKLKMTWYRFDCLLEAYEDTQTGELTELEPTVYGYEIGKGSISGTKILNGSIDGSTKLRDVSIGIAKIAVAAIEQLSANAITALIARINEVIAGKITTDELYAGIAEIVALKVSTLEVKDIETDTLAAELARLQVLIAGTASFDRVTVQHLVAEALHMTFGVGDTVFIRNLAVDFAQMVSAQIGSLCIKASDGRYYTIDVNPDGTVSATLATVTDGEISAGQTDSGRVILETNIVASKLNTSNLLATYALVNQIDAARIDVDQLFAREAFITKLATSLIIGGKSLTQIAGEVTSAQSDADFATPIDSEEPPETAPASGKLWIDRGTTPPIFRRWKGQDSSTERDWGEAFALTSHASPNAYYDNSTGLLESIDSAITTFMPGQEGSGTPGPGNIRELRGYTHSALWQNSYGQTESVNQKSRIEFGETIYGAEIDWLNGIWKKTHWEYVLSGEENISVITHNGAARFNIRIPDDKYRPAASRVPYCTHFYGTEAPYGANNVDFAICVDANWIYLTASGLLGEVVNARNYLKNQAAAGKPVRVVVKLKEPIVHTFTPAAVDVFESMLFIHVSPDTVVAPRTLAVTGTFSGWETLNSAEDIRTAQTQIQEQQQNAQAAIDELRTAVVTDNEGVHVRKVDNDDVQLIRNEVLITQKDVSIVSDNKPNSTFGNGYIRLLDMVIRAASNGIVIEAAEV